MEYLCVYTGATKNKVEADCKWGFRLVPVEKEPESEKGLDEKTLGTMLDDLRLVVGVLHVVKSHFNCWTSHVWALRSNQRSK